MDQPTECQWLQRAPSALIYSSLQLKGLLKQMLQGDYRDFVDPRDKAPPPAPTTDEALLLTSQLMEEAMAEVRYTH